MPMPIRDDNNVGEIKERDMIIKRLQDMSCWTHVWLCKIEFHRGS